jgi:hypothetical protein
MPDKGLHQILVGLRARRAPQASKAATLSEDDLRAISDFLRQSLHLEDLAPAVQRSENRDDGARQRIRGGGSYVHGDSPRGRRMRELAAKRQRGELGPAEYRRLLGEAMRLSSQ